MLERRVCVAPMMGRTDRHFRYLMRLLAPHTLLYSEMVTADALIHGDPSRFLRHRDDLPCALQLGGSDPAKLAQCARQAEEFGYSEINLNLGCPSDQVRSGRMGACLMQEPELVAECLDAMGSAVTVPVTIKCRTGIDDCDSYEYFASFMERLARGGCDVFIVHARRAILEKLSPRANRTVPALHYDYVYRLKRERPELTLILNGGLAEEQNVHEALQLVDGVMIGREAYRNPMFIAGLDRVLYGETGAALDRRDAAQRYLDYMKEELASGEPLMRMVRHMQGLFLGMAGARHYRRLIGEVGGHSMAAVEDAVSAILAPETMQYAELD